MNKRQIPIISLGEEHPGTRTSLLALLGSILYATVRYQVFKGVPWSDWPAYTLNKAFGLAALLLLVLSVLRKPLAQESARGEISHMAGVFAATHVMLSLFLLSPAYYESFFRNNKLTAAVGIALCQKRRGGAVTP